MGSVKEEDVRMNLKRYLQEHGWMVHHIPDFTPVSKLNNGSWVSTRNGGSGESDEDMHSKPDLIAFTRHENKKMYVEVKKADISALQNGSFSCSFNCKDIKDKQRLFLDNRDQEGWTTLLAIGSIPKNIPKNIASPRRGFVMIPWKEYVEVEHVLFKDLNARGTTIKWEEMRELFPRRTWRWVGTSGKYHFEPEDEATKMFLENNKKWRKELDQYETLSLRRKQ
jgi:hypothetical protein